MKLGGSAFYSELGEYAKAVPLLEEAWQSQPDDEQVLLGLAYALALSGRGDDEQRVIEDLLINHPESASLHMKGPREAGPV
jgi:hypothetical protein